MLKKTAIAHPNIALVKYWGKRDERLNLPAVGSISITLADLWTETTVAYEEGRTADTLILNGAPARAEQTRRVSGFLDLVRDLTGTSRFAHVESRNNFPTGAGLASSASAFASLALAATRAPGLKLTSDRLSELARRGSGSAARSIFGGFVEMKMGTQPDGSDAVAMPLAEADFWDLTWLIIITTEQEKSTGSTDGMRQSEQTSPYYQQWIDTSPGDLDDMRTAILQRDFTRMGEIMEHSCLKMHALTLSSRPPLLYWNETTVAIMHAIQHLRREGVPVYYTIDAGPQVKALCPPEYADQITAKLEPLTGVKRIIRTKPGPPARIVGDTE